MVLCFQLGPNHDTHVFGRRGEEGEITMTQLFLLEEKTPST